MNQLIPLILLVSPFVGCSPSPDPNPPVVLPADTDYGTYLSWEIAVELFNGNANGPSPNPNPTPSPNVKIGDKCPKCEGTGKLDGDKDGVVDSLCRYCREDGVVDEGDPILGTGAVKAVEKSILVEEKVTNPPYSAPKEIIELTDATFNSVLASPVPVLIETYGAGCTPCLQLTADIKKIHALYGRQLPIYRMSVDTNPGGKAALKCTRIPGLYLVQNKALLSTPLIGYHGLERTVGWIKQSVPLSP